MDELLKFKCSGIIFKIILETAVFVISIDMK